MSQNQAVNLGPLIPGDTYSPPTTVPSVLNFRPWPSRQERIGTSGPTHCTQKISRLGRESTPLGCCGPLTHLHRCIDISLYYETWEHVPVHWRQGKCQLWSNFFMYRPTVVLTYWGRDKMAAISQTTFSNGFSWMKMLEFRLRFHWSLFLRFQLTIIQHWFR